MGSVARAAGIIFLGGLLLTGCGVKLAREVGDKPPTRTATPATIAGRVTTSEGDPLDLGAISQSLILTFGQDSCLVCREEALEFATYFSSHGGLPRNAEFVTILVGALREDAVRWKARNGITWTVAFDEGDGLFRRYCPEEQTPCTITFNRITNQPRSFFRKATVAEIEGETGPWVY